MMVQFTKKLSVEQLNCIHTKNSNPIVALMMHVATTEVIYQDITFKNLNNFAPENNGKWGTAMDLGLYAQTKIKGNNITYYTNAMNEARSKILAEFKKRDDE